MKSDDDALRLVVKPVPGRLVRRPYTFRILREEGEEIPVRERAYFHRMLRAGDVVLVPPRTKPAKET